MTATANFRQMAQHIGLAICGLMMRTAFGVFGILWGIIREIVNGLFQLPYQISCLVLVLFNAFCITMYDDVGN